jgi:hypothetical protein
MFQEPTQEEMMRTDRILKAKGCVPMMNFFDRDFVTEMLRTTTRYWQYQQAILELYPPGFEDFGFDMI